MGRPRLTISIGDKFNLLTIAEKIKNRHNQIMLRCQCECGKTISTLPWNLINDHTKSCGCHKTKLLVQKSTKYTIGDKLGMLTIIGDSNLTDKRGRKLVSVRCECGKIRDKNITTGGESCGCKVRTSPNPILTEWRRAKISAGRRKSRPLEFSLTVEEYGNLIQSNCYYCDEPPSQAAHNSLQLKKNGIDRLNNDIGYIESNCVGCCKDCNYAKRMLSTDKFFELIEKIYNKHLNK